MFPFFLHLKTLFPLIIPSTGLCLPYSSLPRPRIRQHPPSPHARCPALTGPPKQATITSTPPQDPAFILSVCKSFIPVYAAPGDLLYREGAFSTEMFFLQSGLVEMLKTSERSFKQQVAHTLMAPAYFGEASLLTMSTSERRMYSARAAVFSCLFSFSRKQLNRLLLLFPHVETSLKELARTRLPKQNPNLRLKKAIRSAILALKLMSSKPDSSFAAAMVSDVAAEEALQQDSVLESPTESD
eukprot:1002266-Pleurochrysis_carterae.AAC.1